MVVAALAPLFTTPTEAQTNPQTTDIFTGQFIPAYFGAAYDPTEAFKQMAGLTTYVFAYDTWGKVVNNFAYKTQIKADGSFQAAGLPNASHYGVCFKASDSAVTEYFRAPLQEDGIQSAFAYSQATLATDENINTQIADKPVNFSSFNGGAGCRVFLTSSRQVDIANHINIFPLVPKSILSVIITDQSAGTTDFYNSDKPYEIYAQRVVINNTKSESRLDEAYGSGSICVDADCQANQNELLSDDNTVAVGPVIRGRSIPYTPTTEDGAAPQGGGTIFQAFAPRGMYAITYWRPDSRSANANMTYLAYDGISPLDTPYNGIAIEEVEYPTPGNWQQLSTRSALEAGHQAWVAQPYTANAWGMATRGKLGRLVPQRNIELTVSDYQVGFMDIFSRECVSGGGAQSHKTSVDGLYILSSACGDKNSSSVLTQTGGSISTRISALSSNISGEESNERYGIDIQINGPEGPSRRDIQLSLVPSNVQSGTLMRDGHSFSFARVDLKVDGKMYKNVAQADSTGFFYIPSSYFNKNPYAQYELSVRPPYNAPDFENQYQNTFALDNSQVLAANHGMGADLGIIAINERQPGQVESFLANLSLDSIFNVLRFPTAYAQRKIGADPNDEHAGTLEKSIDDIWKFEIDLEALGDAKYYFTPANYKLETVEINPPEVGLEGSGIPSEYEYFNRAPESEDSYDGSWLEGTGSDKTSLQIKGVQLKYNDGRELIAGRFIDLNTTKLRFNLRVRFEYKAESTPAPITAINDQPVEVREGVISRQNSSSGQENGLPKILEATWPIEIEAITNGDNLQDASAITSFNVRYNPIVLDVAAPNCGGGSLLKDGLTDVIKNGLCKLVIGGINGVKRVVNFLADNFLSIDPLNYPGANIVIKYWNVIRNLVNSLAVLILLVAGVAIMLQYEPTTYNLQSVLKKLIISVVLVNFSILLIQISIDIANVLAQGGYYMLNSMFEADSSGLANSNAAIGALSASLIGMLVAAVASGFTGFMAAFVFFGAIILLLLYVCWKIIIQYFFRMVTLWICIVLAPAAFAARVLPGTASYFGKWKNVLVGTLVAQAALALMLGLSLALIYGIKTASGGMEAFVLVIAAFALLYMSTKVPNKAAAMMGTDLAGSLESKAIAGLGTASSAWKNARIARRQNKMAKEDRENMLGIGKEKRTENRKALEEDLKARGVGRVGRFVAGRRFALGQKSLASATMGADSYNRKLREFKRVGRLDYISGVRGSDVDHAEEEAHKAADAMYVEEGFAKFPHRAANERDEQIKDLAYKQADNTAGIFSRGKLTNARDNMALVDGRYGANLHHLDASGKIRTDGLGRQIRMGDLSGFGTATASEYSTGFKQVFDDQLTKLEEGESRDRGTAAVSALKAHITSSAGTANDMNDNFKGFFENFSYGGATKHKAWANLYRDLGEDINPEVAKYPDMYGKVVDDVVYKSAGKADSSWEASLRTANSQSKNGASDRSIITIAAGSEYDATPLLTTNTGVHTPADLGPGLPLVHGNPTSGTITGGRSAQEIARWLKLVSTAYQYVHTSGNELSQPNSPVRPQNYLNAVIGLQEAGYQITPP